MAINKVVYDGNTLVDLTSDTVTPDALVVGHTAHGANGEKVSGSNPYEKSATDTEVQTQADLIAQIGAALEGKAIAGGGGFVVKSGTTTSRTIDTGLSDVEQFFMYKESQTGTGLIRLHYTKSATSRMYASAWSTQNYGTKTITNGTGGVSVSGGTVTISATQAAQGALTSNVTYKWVAVGTE